MPYKWELFVCVQKIAEVTLIFYLHYPYPFSTLFCLPYTPAMDQNCIHLIAGSCFYYTLFPIIYCSSIFDAVCIAYKLGTNKELKKPSQDRRKQRRICENRRDRYNAYLRDHLYQMERERANRWSSVQHVDVQDDNVHIWGHMTQCELDQAADVALAG
jgi:hypothetical protein